MKFFALRRLAERRTEGVSRPPLSRALSCVVLGSFLVAVAPVQSADPVVTASGTAFDAKPWLDDLHQTQVALATKYANLEWAVFERELDLTAIFAETKQRIEAASSTSEARAAFDRFTRKLGDGHVQFQWPTQHDAAQPPTANCAALGYDKRMFGAPVAALAPGYVPLPSGAAEFPAGTLEVGGHKVGVILRSAADGHHRQGLRVAASLPEAVERALRLHGPGAAASAGVRRQDALHPRHSPSWRATE